MPVLKTPKSLLLLALLICRPLHAQEPEWRILFDGRDTSAFREVQSDAFPAEGWKVQDGALVHEKGGGGGDLVTRATFDDFELEFEWKVAPGANSGVIYWIQDGTGPTYASGAEFQVLDDAAHPNLDAKQRCAGLYGLYAAEAFELKPALEWNRGRILAKEGRIEHWVGDRLVVRAVLDSEDFRQRVANSKFAKMPHFLAQKCGRIALQDHGDGVAYRNLRIREWPRAAGKAVDLLRKEGAPSLADWRFVAKPTDDHALPFSLTDAGALRCLGAPTGYLQCATKSSDYLLEFDWRFAKEGGNSGLLLGISGEDRVWPRCVEAQLQHGRAGDVIVLGDFPTGGPSGRTSGRRTDHLAAVEHPVGEWNRYRVTVRGQKLWLEINGRFVNEYEAKEPIRGAIGLQSEGVEIHFRKLSLTPLSNG